MFEALFLLSQVVLANVVPLPAQNMLMNSCGYPNSSNVFDALNKRQGCPDGFNPCDSSPVCCSSGATTCCSLGSLENVVGCCAAGSGCNFVGNGFAGCSATVTTVVQTVVDVSTLFHTDFVTQTAVVTQVQDVHVTETAVVTSSMDVDVTDTVSVTVTSTATIVSTRQSAFVLVAPTLSSTRPSAPEITSTTRNTGSSDALSVTSDSPNRRISIPSVVLCTAWLILGLWTVSCE